MSFVCDAAFQLIFLLGLLNCPFFYSLLPGSISYVTTLRFNIFSAFKREDFKWISTHLSPIFLKMSYLIAFYAI